MNGSALRAFPGGGVVHALACTVRDVDRRLALWLLVVFFGSSIVFRAIRRATEDESIGVTLVLGLAAFGLIVAAITVFVKRRDRDKG